MAASKVEAVSEYRAYDPVGNRLSKQQNSSVVGGTFNNLNQLTSLTGGSGQLQVSGTVSKTSKVTVQSGTSSYPATTLWGTNFSANIQASPGTNNFSVIAQDANTNLVTNTYQIAVNALEGSRNFTYDANGNLTSDQNGTTYDYDAQNRLIRVETKGTNPTVVTMAYDARNRVVSRTINGDETTYVYDGWTLINEYDSYGIEDAHYIHGPAIDEILTHNATLGGAAYYTQDGNGNVTTITSSSGAVQERYTYDVYGTPTITTSTGVIVSSSAVGNRFLFTGREYLAEIGLYDYRNRVYSPGLGRFLQTDPIRLDTGDVNIYRYCGNDPVNWIDPDGLWQITITFGAGVAAQVTIAYNPKCAQLSITEIFGIGAGGSIKYSTSNPNLPNGLSGAWGGSFGAGIPRSSFTVGSQWNTGGYGWGSIGGRLGPISGNLSLNAHGSASLSYGAPIYGGASTIYGGGFTVAGKIR